MAREKELFRDNLERLDRAFPGKELLTIQDVAQYTGLCANTVRRYLTFTVANRFSKAAVAKWLS